MEGQRSMGAAQSAVHPHPDESGPTGPEADQSPASLQRQITQAIGHRIGGDNLGTIEGEVGPEAYARLLAAFRRALPLQLAELRSAAATGDVPAARYVAHQLK